VSERIQEDLSLDDCPDTVQESSSFPPIRKSLSMTNFRNVKALENSQSAAPISVPQKKPNISSSLKKSNSASMINKDYKSFSSIADNWKTINKQYQPARVCKDQMRNPRVELLVDNREKKRVANPQEFKPVEEEGNYFRDKLRSLGIACSSVNLPLGDFLWVFVYEGTACLMRFGRQNPQSIAGLHHRAETGQRFAQLDNRRQVRRAEDETEAVGLAASDILDRR
jgi:hypothetical protein